MEKDFTRKLFRSARGNWDAFDFPIEDVQLHLEAWRTALQNIERPWLCWSVNNEWSLVQQRLVQAVGWTPVVGFDPRAGRPNTVAGAVAVDFNAGFDFPALSMLFPLEFVFLFADRLAFWHSDLLVREDVLRKLAGQFAALADGEVAAVDDRGSLIARLRGHTPRFWELIGCTTRAASRDQFEKGCGWWRHIVEHPNCPPGSERKRRRRYGYDHGVGVYYWHKRYGGKVHGIPESLVEEGHCTRIKNVSYERLSPEDERRDLSQDLPHNYDLAEVCARLDLSRFLTLSTA
ncbi:MAG TPA: hypothetical protein ENJ84_01800 [Gammaproteobacteria bacterium]|nr:hypothetical protein [Gammaproteobacteria bacterium]